MVWGVDMSLARVVVASVLVEGRLKASVARDYGVARSWVQELVRRFEAESAVAVSVEVNFLALYDGQPLFGDISRYLH